MRKETIIFGPVSVGKSTLLDRMATGKFNESAQATIGTPVKTIKPRPDTDTWLTFRDIAGDEINGNMLRVYFHEGVVAFLLCVDCSSAETIRLGISFLNELHSKASNTRLYEEGMPVRLVFTKCDLNANFKVDKVMEDFKETGVPFSEDEVFVCSSKTGKNVSGLVNHLAKVLASSKASSATSSGSSDTLPATPVVLASEPVAMVPQSRFSLGSCLSAMFCSPCCCNNSSKDPASTPLNTLEKSTYGGTVG